MILDRIAFSRIDTRTGYTVSFRWIFIQPSSETTTCITVNILQYYPSHSAFRGFSCPWYRSWPLGLGKNRDSPLPAITRARLGRTIIEVYSYLSSRSRKLRATKTYAESKESLFMRFCGVAYEFRKAGSWCIEVNESAKEKEGKNERREKVRAFVCVCERERESQFGGHAFAALPTDRVCMRACIHACKSGRVSARFVMQCNVFSRLARPHLPCLCICKHRVGHKHRSSMCIRIETADTPAERVKLSLGIRRVFPMVLYAP